MNVVRFQEGDPVDGIPPMMPEDWRALYKAGWVVDWAFSSMPRDQLAIFCGRGSAAYAAYYPAKEVQRAVDSWQAALPARSVPDFGSAPLPEHLVSQCPDVVPFRYTVEVPARAVVREMRDGEIATLASQTAIGAFRWVSGALRERGCGKWHLVPGDIARAVRATVWEHLQGAAGAQCLSATEGTDK